MQGALGEAHEAALSNTSRPKKAAKHLAAWLSQPLSSAQRAVARACGYRDWHELTQRVDAGSPCALDQDITIASFIERQSRLTLAIARELSAFDGDVQYALAEARLTGDRSPQLDEQIAIRLACWRATGLPTVDNRQRGAVGKLRTVGRNGEAVILRERGRPTYVISHQAISTVGDFEYVSPRVAPPLFVPMRLYLPYGYWTEHDGSRVIFSRDYKPMWRLRGGQSIDRVDPWLRVSFVEQNHLWPGSQAPWSSSELKAFLDAYLVQNGIFGLPILADALPLLVHDQFRRDPKMGDAAELLRDHRAALTIAA